MGVRVLSRWLALAGIGLALGQAPTPAPPGLTDLEVGAVVLAAEDTKRLEGLIPLLDDERPPVRARVALALARIGVPDGLEPALRLLGDAETVVRRQAAFALGRLELDLAGDAEAGLRDRTRAALAAMLEDDPAVAAVAAWSLGQVGGARETLAAKLAETSSEADPDLLSGLLDAWWRADGAAAEPVRRFLDAPSAEVRLAAVHALRRLDLPAGLPLLEPRLDDPDAEVRAMAIRSLGDAPARLIDERGVAALRDADRRVQCAAADWLGAAWARDGAGPPGEDALAAVLRRSLDRSPMVRGCALGALGLVVESRAVAADRLLEALDDEEPAVRAIALAGLAEGDRSLRERAWERFAAGRPAAALVGGPIGWATVLRWSHELGTETTSDLVVRATGDDRAAASAAASLLAEVAPAEADRLARADVVAADLDRVAAALRALARLVRGGMTSVDADLQEAVWRIYWDRREAPAARGARAAALDLLIGVAPATLQSRTSLLVTDPDRVLRLRALRALGTPAYGDALVPARFERPADLDDAAALAARVLELERTPPRLVMETPRGTILVELRADWAPRTVARFVDLAAAGRLGGNEFHRVIPGFVAQGGALEEPPASLPNEDSMLDYRAGRVGLALAGRDTGTSQFYITRADQPHLRGLYPVFGEVVEGRRVVDRLMPGDPVDIRLAGS